MSMNKTIHNKALFERATAILFAVTVVGGVGGLLTMSLAASAQPAPALEVATAQTAIEPVNETVVVYGTRPANYASLVAHRKYSGAAGIQYAALQHR